MAINEKSGYLLDESMNPSSAQGMSQSEMPMIGGQPVMTDLEGNPVPQDNYATISDFKTYVDAGKISFTPDATIIVAGCNVATSQPVQDAMMYQTTIDEYNYSGIYFDLFNLDPFLAESYRTINFPEELSEALQLTVIAASSTTSMSNGIVNIYNGGSGVKNSSTRTAAAWYQYSKDGSETNLAGNNLTIVR